MNANEIEALIYDKYRHKQMRKTCVIDYKCYVCDMSLNGIPFTFMRDEKTWDSRPHCDTCAAVAILAGEDVICRAREDGECNCETPMKRPMRLR